MRSSLLFRIIAGLFLGATSAWAQTFTEGKVGDGITTSNLYSSAAHSPSGDQYIFWLKGSTANVVYMLHKWNSTLSTWEQVSSFTPTQALSGSQGGQNDVSLAIDKDGGFHVVFRVYASAVDLINAPRVIMYGYSANGTSWSFSQAYNTGSSPNGWFNVDNPTIAVDGSDNPHVVFTYADAGPHITYLKYATRSGGAWSAATTLYTAGTSSEIPSNAIAVQSDGKVHVMFAAEANGSGLDGNLYYLTNASGSWPGSPTELATGATNASAAVETSIVLDSNNKVHAVRQDYQRKIYYLTNKSGSFTSTQINGNLVGAISYEALAINSSDTLFLAYNASPTSTNIGAVGYAYLLSGGSTWTTGTAFTSNANTTMTLAWSADLTDGNVATIPFNHSNNPRELHFVHGTLVNPNAAPTFVGSTTTLAVNQNAAATDIKSLLHANDGDSSQTLTWSVTTAPSHGSLSSFTGATAASGSADITPGGTLTYTPTSGYSGSDSFTIKVSDGTAEASRTIAVTVSDVTAPTVASVVRLSPAGQAIAAGPVTFRVTYSEAVTNVSAANFAVQGVNGGTVTGTIAVTGTDNTATRDVTVTVTGGAGEFTLKVIN